MQASLMPLRQGLSAKLKRASALAKGNLRKLWLVAQSSELALEQVHYGTLKSL